MTSRKSLGQPTGLRSDVIIALKEVKGEK